VGLAAAYLPPSHIKDVLIDSCAMPGAIITALVYPEGPHTGSGAPSWGLVVLVLNFAVYCGLWLALLRGVQRWRIHR
jgi:hypothetical protein